jgi:hypothetical protein
MKILFLDDDEDRHRKFKMQTIGCDVTHVYTYDEAIAALMGMVLHAAGIRVIKQRVT